MAILFISLLSMMNDPKNLEFSKTLTLQGPIGSSFSFEFNPGVNQYVRIHFQEHSASIFATIYDPSGKIVAQKKKLDADWTSFLLSIPSTIIGVYEIKVEILGVFDLKETKSLDSGDGVFKITFLDLLSQMDYEKREKENRDDPRVRYIRDNGIPLKNIDPMNKDISDLMPLKSRIGEARIVMLGEPSHSSAESNFAKLRLIRFLHQEMGFEVLAFESDFFSCFRYQSLVELSDSASEVDWTEAIYPWNRIVEFSPTMDYVKSTYSSDMPMKIAGFDSQVYRAWSQNYLPTELSSFLSSKNIKIPKVSYFDILTNCLKRVYIRGQVPAPSVEESEFVYKTTEDLLEKVRTDYSLNNDLKSGFWVHVLESIVSFLPWQLKAPPEGLQNMLLYGHERDNQMGKNILWLADNQYRGKKIIIWASNYHIQYNHRLATHPDDYISLPNEFIMGEVVRKKLGDQIYSILITNYEGTYGYPRPGLRVEEFQNEIVLDQDPGMELEELFIYAGFENAFLHLSGQGNALWLNEPLPGKVLGHICLKAPWPKLADSILFIRKSNHVTLTPEK